MNQQTTDIQYILLSMLLTSFFSITATAKKVDVKNGCIVVIDKSAEGKNSHEGFGIVIDTVNSSSINYDILTSSIIELCPNFTKDDANVPSNLCQSVRNIGEYASNQADYSLEMTYDDMYRVIGKSQHLIQSGVQFNTTLSSGYDLTYTYGQDTGKRFQMSTVNDVNYRTDNVYTSDDNVIASHYYEYDKNGNIIHAMTSETRADGTTVNLTREEKFRWDEENRLLAISQNGYVSQYWYDADGERVVKEHGANQAVFVNSEQNAVFTRTDKFTVYPNPYFSYSDDGRYTKHIYIGAERIASQVGGKPYPSPNTESVSVAGRSNGIDIRVDYSGKLDQHLAQIDSVYDAFDLPYNGTNHDSYYDNYFFDRLGYWDNTEGMALNGGEPEMPRGIQDRDLLYYYHRDHLGSSTAVSNDDGKLSQQIEYLPYGEVFLEKQMASGDYHSPYKFNGKELDEETGLYYYGARYMNPRLSIWYATDPSEEKYPDISSYAYCKNNPVIKIDPNGADDYRFDKETGDFLLMKQTDDEADRVLNYHFNKKTGKYEPNTKFFQTKTLIDNIEKGILRDGINFKENNNVIPVGGNNNVTEEGVKSFVLRLSELVGKEIKGFSYSSEASTNVTDVLIGKYLNNTYKKSYGNLRELQYKYGNEFSFDNVLLDFHTHPDGKLGATLDAPEISDDVSFLRGAKPMIPNARFIILYRIPGQNKPGEYDYTHNYGH